MRIIAGRFKGRRLVSFQGSHIRPTTDRVKETLFNILMSYLPDAKVLDLFSGTGNLGIEALSRGATHVTCVENHRKSLEILKKNLDVLKISAEIEVVKQDVFQYLKRVNGAASAGNGFDVVFIDPPFTEKWAHDVLTAVAAADILVSSGRVVIEASRHERVDAQYGPLQLLDRRDFGDKSAFIFGLKEG